MSGQSHPMTMIMATMQRHEDFQALAVRDRLAQQAQESSPRRRRWPDLSAVKAGVAALALLLMQSHRG